MGYQRIRPEMRDEDITLSQTTPENSSAANTKSLRGFTARLMGAIQRITGVSNWWEAPDHSMRDMFRYSREASQSPLQLSGQISLSGGRLKWTSRMVIMPTSEQWASDSHISIPMPTSGVLVDGTGAERANSSGIQINHWEALWLTHTRGSDNSTGNTLSVSLYGSPYSDAKMLDPNAFLICVRNGDEGNMLFANGLVVRDNGYMSSYGGAVFEDTMRRITENKNTSLIGGGTISYGVTATDKLKWTRSMFFDSVHSDVSSSGWISLGVTPTSGVTDQNGVERANADGITLTNWETLWFIHTRGGSQSVGNSWKVATTGTLTLYNLVHNPDAYLIAERYADSPTTLHFPLKGLTMRVGTYLYDDGASSSYNAGQLTISHPGNYPLRIINANNAGAGADIGVYNVLQYCDAEWDEQGWAGINPNGDFEICVNAGDEIRFQTPTSNWTVYHSGNSEEIHGVKRVKAATLTSNHTGTQTIDGVACGVGDRVLVINDDTPSWNGIWEVQSGIWTRPYDYNSARETYRDQLIVVGQGTTYGGTIYRQTSNVTTLEDGTGVGGATAITFAVIAGAGAVTGHNFWSATHPDVDSTDSLVDGAVPTYRTSNNKFNLEKITPPSKAFYVSGAIAASKTGVGHRRAKASTAVEVTVDADVAPAGGTVTFTAIKEAGGPGGTPTTIGAVTLAIGDKNNEATGLNVSLAAGDTIRVDMTTNAGYTVGSCKDVVVEVWFG